MTQNSNSNPTSTVPPELQGIEEFIESAMAQWQVPGLALGVIKDGEVVYARGFGHRSLAPLAASATHQPAAHQPAADTSASSKSAPYAAVSLGSPSDPPVTPDTLFAIASTSKAFNTMALAMLVEEGRISWDDKVRAHLPEFTLYDEVASNRLTIRDLVTHRTGLPRHDFLWDKTTLPREELLARLRYLKPNKDIRTTYQYQNMMFTVASMVVERVTGQRWEAFVKERIFDAIGMTRSNFSVADSQRDENYAEPYRFDRFHTLYRNAFNNVDAIAGAGNINSTVNDLLQWLKVHLKAHPVKLVSESQLREMHRPQMIVQDDVKYPETSHHSYGLGWNTHVYRGHTSVHHGGNLDGFTSRVAILPAHNLGIVVLTNNGSTRLPEIMMYALYDRFLHLDRIDWNGRLFADFTTDRAAAAQAITDTVADKVPGTNRSHPLAAYVGEYEHPGYGVIKVTFAGTADATDATNAPAIAATTPATTAILADGSGPVFRMQYYDWTADMYHHHYDVFDLVDEELDTPKLATFHLDAKGQVASLSIDMESSVDDIEFSKREKSE